MENPYRVGDLITYRPVVGGRVKGKVIGFTGTAIGLYVRVRITNRTRVASYCPGEVVEFGVRDAFLSKRERKVRK